MENQQEQMENLSPEQLTARKEEMKQFFHQTLLTMADSFERATGETLICEDLRDYCYHFADKMNVFPE